MNLKTLANLFTLNTEYEVIGDDNNELTISREELSGEVSRLLVRIDQDQEAVVMKPEGGEEEKRRSIPDMIATLCNFKRMRNHHEREYKRWEELEGDGLPYIEPMAAISGDRKTVNLHEYMLGVLANKSEKKYDGRITFLQGEYGQGKTSFCRHFAHKASEVTGSPFVFVFYLSENRLNSVTEVIENQLSTEYNLSMAYSIFAELCKEGYFCAILDAYDQLYYEDSDHHFKDDFTRIQYMSEDKGRVLITARSSYYQDKFRAMVSANNTLKTEIVYLDGFNIDLVRKYVAERNKTMSVMPKIEKDWPRLEKILGKPLHLRLFMKYHERIDDWKNMTSYDLIDAGYEAWVEDREDSKDDIESAIKVLVSIAIAFGLNRKVDAEIWKNNIKEMNISMELEYALGLLSEFLYVRISNGNLFFPVPAYLEYFWVKFVVGEICDHKNTMSSDKYSFMRNHKLNPETLDALYGRLKSEKDKSLIASWLRKLVLCTKRTQDPKKCGYLGGNSLSILCRLYTVDEYRKVLDEFKSSKDFKLLDLTGANLRHMDFSDCDFSSSILNKANLSFTQLKGAKFILSEMMEITCNEHGSITACAFTDTDPLKVVAGTETGALLTYDWADDFKIIANAHADAINDICVMEQRVFTASTDKKIACFDVRNRIDRRGNTPLPSIVNTIDSLDGYVYAGTSAQGVYKADLNLRMKEDPFIRPTGGSWITRLRVFVYDGETYFAIVLGDGRLVVVNVEVAGNSLKEGLLARAKGVMRMPPVAKGITGITVTDTDILYVEDRTALWAIDLKGAKNGRPVERRCDEDLDGVIDIAYVRSEQLVYCLCGFDEGDRTEVWVGANGSWGFQKARLPPLDGKIKTFAVSADGSYLAFAGERLTIVERDSVGGYKVVGRPVDIKMDCEGMKLTQCLWSSENAKENFFIRGAKFE